MEVKDGTSQVMGSEQHYGLFHVYGILKNQG